MKPQLLLPGVVAVVVLSSGCSTTLTQGQVEAMNKPTIAFNCTGPCDLAYTDPRDRGKLPTNGWDVGMAAIQATAGAVSSTAPWAAIGFTAVQGIKNAVGNDSSDRSVVYDSRVTDNSTVDSRDQSTDMTHEPTVVVTPGPEIVQQPPPVIVRPEVIQQPAAPAQETTP